MQLHELACSSLSLHAVTQACMQFLSSSEQLTRISQCLLYLYIFVKRLDPKIIKSWLEPSWQNHYRDNGIIIIIILIIMEVFSKSRFLARGVGLGENNVGRNGGENRSGSGYGLGHCTGQPE